MMRRIILCTLLFAANGCASLKAPMPGLLFTHNDNGLVATANPAGNRVGEACLSSYLGLISLGDATIETARRNGGITTITSVDESTTSILFFYGKYCVTVRGK
jgi:hypothetical protein